MNKQSELVAYCPEHGWWLPPEEIGEKCPDAWCERKLVKRRGYVCRESEQCHCFFLNWEELLNHTCGECY